MKKNWHDVESIHKNSFEGLMLMLSDEKRSLEKHYVLYYISKLMVGVPANGLSTTCITASFSLSLDPWEVLTSAL